MLPLDSRTFCCRVGMELRRSCIRASPLVKLAATRCPVTGRRERVRSARQGAPVTRCTMAYRIDICKPVLSA
jgi:hypothetical protein